MAHIISSTVAIWYVTTQVDHATTPAAVLKLSVQPETLQNRQRCLLCQVMYMCFHHTNDTIIVKS